MDIVKELEHLKEIEIEALEKIKTEEDSEAEINSLKLSITDLLYANNNRAKVGIFGRTFDVGLIISPKKKEAILVVTDLAKFNIAKGKYKPTRIHAEFDTDYSVKTNIATAVEAWLRYLTGTIKPETLEQETNELTFRKEK